jgi:choline transport protein
MVSRSPIAGAVYYWTAEHSPTRVRMYLSWAQGWITLLGWQAAVASAAFMIAELFQGMIAFNHSSYTPERWHTTLLVVCLSGLACLMNTVGKRLLPLWELLAGMFHV